VSRRPEPRTADRQTPTPYFLVFCPLRPIQLMNTRFISAANAIARYFKQLEAQRGAPFSDTFRNALNRDAVTPTSVGVPLTLLRELVASQEPHGLPPPDGNNKPLSS
jgi:hypothetical protein